MYANVPTGKLTKIIDLMCNKYDINGVLKHERMIISQTLIKQNYFQFQGFLSIQEDVLAMSAPTSSIFSEIYLIYIENTKIIDILLEHHILGYICYVLIVYKYDTTNIYDAIDTFNNIIPNIKYTMEDEKENTSTSWVSLF
jgi:hypothetical protein